MQPKVNVITLGTSNIEKSREFYEKGLGWKVSKSSNENFVAFQLQNLVLCLYPNHLLAEDANTAMNVEKTFKGITLSYNAYSKEEVDQILNQAVAEGAKLEKKAQNVFWGGYSGYFSDPDGHFWEVAWNPHWVLDSNGLLHLE